METMSPEQELMRGEWQGSRSRMPPTTFGLSDKEVEELIDLYSGFASPVMKMEQMGVKHATAGLAGEEKHVARSALRRILSAANAVPNEGPQSIFDRTGAVKYVLGLPCRREEQWYGLLHHTGEKARIRLREIKNAIEWADEFVEKHKEGKLPGVNLFNIKAAIEKETK